MASPAAAPSGNGKRRRERFALSAARLAKVSMATGAILAALVMGVTLRVVRLQAHDEEWVSHTIEARQRIAEIRALVRGAGSGTRVYLMTHAESYLDQYHAAVQTIPVRLDELGDLTADNAVQRANM
jgi:CHASE3 domain sensor protein